MKMIERNLKFYDFTLLTLHIFWMRRNKVKTTNRKYFQFNYFYFWKYWYLFFSLLFTATNLHITFLTYCGKSKETNGNKISLKIYENTKIENNLVILPVVKSKQFDGETAGMYFSVCNIEDFLSIFIF